VKPISHQARLWALGEIVRRASIDQEFLDDCDCQVTREESILRLPDGKCSIRFRNAIESWDEIARGKLHTSKARWMSEPDGVRRLVPDFIVPYCADRTERPLFERLDSHTVISHYDLPASVLFTLSRAEETISQVRDRHGRFPTVQSTAFHDEFLHRPVVDEYGLALEQAIGSLIPSYPSQRRLLRVKLSHDCDEVGLWPSLRNGGRTERQPSPVASAKMLVPSVRAAIAHATHHHAPLSMCREFSKMAVGRGRSFLQRIRDLAKYSQERGLDSAFYWKGSVFGPYDSGYDPRSLRVASLIAQLEEEGFENGVHPGYETYLQPAVLQQEADLLRQVIGQDQFGGRQHFLRWLPQSWQHWESCGLAYDSSVGYSDRPGFRAGTCIPYRPWLAELDREAHLLEIPLVIMDVALFRACTGYDEAFDSFQQCVERCRLVGGVFTFLCHNEMLASKPGFPAFYAKLLNTLTDTHRFDWRKAGASKARCSPLY